jgi:hypothetical protein
MTQLIHFDMAHEVLPRSEFPWPCDIFTYALTGWSIATGWVRFAVERNDLQIVKQMATDGQRQLPAEFMPTCNGLITTRWARALGARQTYPEIVVISQPGSLNFWRCHAYHLEMSDSETDDTTEWDSLRRAKGRGSPPFVVGIGRPEGIPLQTAANSEAIQEPSSLHLSEVEIIERHRRRIPICLDAGTIARAGRAEAPQSPFDAMCDMQRCRLRRILKYTARWHVTCEITTATGLGTPTWLSGPKLLTNIESACSDIEADDQTGLRDGPLRVPLRSKVSELS